MPNTEFVLGHQTFNVQRNLVIIAELVIDAERHQRLLLPNDLFGAAQHIHLKTFHVRLDESDILIAEHFVQRDDVDRVFVLLSECAPVKSSTDDAVAHHSESHVCARALTADSRRNELNFGLVHRPFRQQSLASDQERFLLSFIRLKRINLSEYPLAGVDKFLDRISDERAAVDEYAVAFDDIHLRNGKILIAVEELIQHRGRFDFETDIQDFRKNLPRQLLIQAIICFPQLWSHEPVENLHDGQQLAGMPVLDENLFVLEPKLVGRRNDYDVLIAFILLQLIDQELGIIFN